MKAQGPYLILHNSAILYTSEMIASRLTALCGAESKGELTCKPLTLL